MFASYGVIVECFACLTALFVLADFLADFLADLELLGMFYQNPLFFKKLFDRTVGASSRQHPTLSNDMPSIFSVKT